MRNRYIFVHRPGAESCLEMFLIPTLVPCALLCEADRDANQPVGEYKTTKDFDSAERAREDVVGTPCFVAQKAAMMGARVGETTDMSQAFYFCHSIFYSKARERSTKTEYGRHLLPC